MTARAARTSAVETRNAGLAEGYTAGYRDGQLAMRERCYRVCDNAVVIEYAKAMSHTPESLCAAKLREAVMSFKPRRRTGAGRGK